MMQHQRRATRALDVLTMAMLAIVTVCAAAATTAWAQDRARTRTQIAAIRDLSRKCDGFRPVADAVLSDPRTINPYGYRFASNVADQMAAMSPRTSPCRDALPVLD